MTAQANQNKEETKVSTSSGSRRKRRHWYDHEKLEIIQKYDANELHAMRGKPNYVSDPKSGEELSIFAIETWKDQFRTFGVLGAKKVAAMSKATPKAMTPASPAKIASSDSDLKDLLLQTLLENQQLKQQLASSKGVRRTPSRETETSL